MRVLFTWLAACLTVAAVTASSVVAQQAQQPPAARLPRTAIDALPPTARVVGDPGRMAIQSQACRTLPVADARRRIVDLALQEWGFFGFPIVEYAAEEEDAEPRVRGRGRSRVGTAESARTAASIGGYWAVAPGGSWILENQNRAWAESTTGVTRWQFPWSAAFISWLMCEGGLGGADTFQRAIAHHSYIDQAIRARDGAAPRAAYVAHDVGEAPVSVGDLLCTSRRPVFRTVADRRRQMGQGARTHCDLVVKVDEVASQILAIGGNVRGVVGLKVLPAVREQGRLKPIVPPGVPNARPVFAHLRLRGEAPAIDTFDRSPVVTALACGSAPRVAVRLPALARLVATAAARCVG
jgi:hypothetical protein